MGTCSYVLTGTDQGMEDTFGTTCHGAVSKLFNLLVINVGRFFFLVFFFCHYFKISLKIVP